MANIASQKKRIARSARERHENLRFASTVKTHMKRLQSAVSAGDDDAADTEHRELISKIDKAVQKGAMHRNTGARKKARAARIRAGEVTLEDARQGKRKGGTAKPKQAEVAAEAPDAQGGDAEAEADSQDSSPAPEADADTGDEQAESGDAPDAEKS